jgi:transcriptional regulator with XRE-family HTH domain
MDVDVPEMRNTHFIPENKNAQYALRNLHQQPTIPAMTVGEKIRAIRLAKEMTIAEVEARAGLTDGNLSRIERGKQWVSEEVLRNIARALSVRVAEFFEDGIPVEAPTGSMHPAVQQLIGLLDQAADEVRLLTVYRLASIDDRREIDAAVADVVERLDIVSILNKRKV